MNRVASHNRPWPLAALALLLAILLGGCGAPAAQNAAQPTGVTAPTAAPEQTPPAPAAATDAAAPSPVPSPTPAVSTVGSGATRITWWHINTQPNERDNWQQLADAYVRQNPLVSIEITVLENEAFKTKLATAMQSGSPPDIFQSWGGGVLKQYGDAGLVRDLSPALAEGGWGDSFQPAPLSLYRFDGKAYGVPWRAGMVGFWYNKALFQQAGIAQPPETWEQLLEAVGKLKAAGITPIALGEREKWPGHFYWVYLATRMGGRSAFERAYSRQGSFADAPFVQAGEKLKQLIDLQPFQTGFLGAGYGDHAALVANGEAAMELMGQWGPGYARTLAQDASAYDASLGFFPFPAVAGQQGDSSDVLGGGDGFAIGKNAPPEAVDFVRYLTSLEHQTAMAKASIAVPPVVKGAEAGLSDPLIQEVQRRAAQANYYQLYYDQYLPPAVGQAVNDATQELFAGTASPEGVASKIEESAAYELAR